VFALRRVSGGSLALTREHESMAAPRHGAIHWSEFDAQAYEPAVLANAAELWAARAEQELHSLALFTDLAAQLQRLGAPLDWSGAFARMIADEVRHTDLCLRMCEALGHPQPPAIDETQLQLLGPNAGRSAVRQLIIAAFCLGETISGRMFRRALKVTDVPLAREVMAAIVSDETFHAELGWELCALSMRDDGPAFERERTEIVAALPRLFRHYAALCGALALPASATDAEDAPHPNFGTLGAAGYARAFFDGMQEDVVPGLVSVGLPEADATYASFLASLTDRS